MMGLIFTLAGIAVFYFLVYRKWDYKNKFTFKTISIYLLLGVTVLSLWIVIGTVADVAEDEQYKMLEHRLSEAEDKARRGDYNWMADSMYLNMDYEEEFEYLWERLTMYSACNRYLIFDAASRAELGEAFEKKAQEYETLLRKTASSPLYEKNVSYGMEFLNKAGLLKTNDPEVLQ